jgi:alanine racemase
VARSEITIDLGALRANVRRLRASISAAELWVVVKADGYGHGALDCARAALDEGARALCVAALAEALELREALPDARILVFGPTADLEVARSARLELCVGEPVPENIPVHVKLDTGMGRWGVSELRSPQRNVVGLMTHLATADSDPEFTRLQIERFRAATAPYAHLTRHVANSAGTLRFPEAQFDAVRCGIAVYGLSPFGADPADDGLTPVLSWRSELALAKLLRPGESTGYGRRFVAERDTWIGQVPVGYADGFRRDMSGTHVLVGGERCRVVGTVSMDALAVELPRELPRGTEVTLVGPGVRVEEHARASDTINWEIVSRIESGPARATRVVV